MRVKTKNLALVFIPLLALIVIIYQVYLLKQRLSPLPNFDVVVKEKIYRSGQIKPEAIEKLAEDYRIKTIICLRGAENRDVSSSAKKFGINVIGVKMKKGETPDMKQTELVLKILTETPVSYEDYKNIIQQWPAPRNTPVRFPPPFLIHCQRGKDRTGFVVAIYRICFQGWSVEKASEEMREHYHLWLVNSPKFLGALKKIVPEQYCPEIYSEYH